VTGKTRWRQIGLAVALLLGGGLLVALLALLREPPADRASHPFNQDRNAIWLEHRWLSEPQPQVDMEALVRGLAGRGVHYVFPHLIAFDAHGRLPPHSREQLRAFLSTVRAQAPRMQVLPWVGGLRAGYRRSRRGTIDLDDLNQRQQIVAECRSLMDEGCDGIHLNIEPVPNGDDGFLSLLRALRPAVEPSGTLSVSATRPAPWSLPVTSRFVWTPTFYEQVAAAADQVVVMGYDTGLPTAALYRRYMAYAAQVTTHTLASHSRARVLIGVPTYDATGLMHRAGVETLENALLGVISGLRGAGGGGTFEGVAVYAEWTTSPEEWAVYERLWRGGAGPAR
jgi:hypothetical protein